MTRRILPAVLLVFSSYCIAHRSLAAGVDVGDAAPPLKVKEWVRGDPVDLSRDASKKLHLVEFWATWCPPCKASVPILTRYQKQFENDLVIVGVTDPEPFRNSPSDIKQFVKQQGATMSYAVAIDDRGATTEAYMDTSQAVGIPQAYLVGRDGRVVWQGSPLDPAMEGVIRDVIAGRYDVASAKRAAEMSREVERRFRALEIAFQMGQIDVVWDGLVDVFKVDAANEMAIRLLTEIYVNERNYADRYQSWLTGYLSEQRSNALAMGTLAGALLSIEDFSARKPELAIDAARAAYEASGKSDRGWIEGYARALYQVGAIDRAIAIQEEAVVKAPDLEREDARKVLDFYRTCKRLQAAVQ